MGRALLVVLALAALVFAGCGDGPSMSGDETVIVDDDETSIVDDEFDMLVLNEARIVDVTVVYPDPNASELEPGSIGQSVRFDQPVSPAIAARDYICGTVPEGGDLVYGYDTPMPPSNSSELIARFKELARATFCPE